MKVGFVLPLGYYDGVGRPPSFREVRDLAGQAEAAGFDALWVFDHLLSREPDRPQRGMWEAWTILSALADATERVELGSLVLCTVWRNPALLAKMAATLDEVSEGRLVLGLGAGWHQPEFDAFGYPFDHLVSRFEEALEIIVPLLRDGQVDFHGRYSEARDCVLLPRGPRTGGPPILIAGEGPWMLRLTATYANAWNTAWVGRADAIFERREAMRAACSAVGRDPATLALTVGVNVTYPESTSRSSVPLDPAKMLSGSPEAVANELMAFARAGVSQVICSARRSSSPEQTSFMLAELTKALQLYRASSGE